MDVKTDDRGLLDRYGKRGDEAAFRELVRRHLNMVYSAASRRVGDGHLAEDVTQAVFMILSQKAKAARRVTPLSRWLLATVRYAAANALKIDRRRRHHEAAAAASRAAGACSPNPSDVLVWQEIATELDDAVLKLSAADRTAVLLRFFEQKPISAVAHALNTTEAAAGMRVTRAVEKLRQRLSRRGIGLAPSGTAGFTALVSAHAVRPAPPKVLTSVSAAAVGGAASGGASAAIAQGAISMMAWTKISTTAALVAAAATLGTIAVVATTNGPARAQNPPSGTTAVVAAATQLNAHHATDQLPATQPLDAASATASAMSTRIEEFVCRKEPLEDALNRFSNLGRFTLNVRWDDLAVGGISRDTPVNLTVRNVSLRKALEVLLASASQAAKVEQPAQRPRMDVLDSGQVLITSRQELFRKFVSERHYDIRDQLVAANDDEGARQQIAGEVVTFIKEVVLPDAWAADQGPLIRINGQSLTIRQTDEGHRAIAALLAQMRDRERRPAGHAVRDQRPPAVKPATASLDAKLGILVFRGATLIDAFAALRARTGQNIFVNWRALEEAKVPKTLPITIDLSNQTLETALGQLLAEVGGSRVPLGFEVDGDVITVSTAADLSVNSYTRVYDIRRAVTGEASREKDIAAVINRVRGIDPLSWREAGGQVGSVRELGGNLIITHTPDVHKRIVAELEDARQAQVPLPENRITTTAPRATTTPRPGR